MSDREMRQHWELSTLAELAEHLGVSEEVAFDWAASAGLEPWADGYAAVEVLGLLAAHGEGVRG